jgi:hypothetical protein
MALVFEGNLNFKARATTWMTTAAAAIPATVAAYYYLDDLYF